MTRIKFFISLVLIILIFAYVYFNSASPIVAIYLIILAYLASSVLTRSLTFNQMMDQAFKNEKKRAKFGEIRSWHIGFLWMSLSLFLGKLTANMPEDRFLEIIRSPFVLIPLLISLILHSTNRFLIIIEKEKSAEPINSPDANRKRPITERPL